MPNSVSLSCIRCSELDIVMHSHSRMNLVLLIYYELDMNLSLNLSTPHISIG